MNAPEGSFLVRCAARDCSHILGFIVDVEENRLLAFCEEHTPSSGTGSVPPLRNGLGDTPPAAPGAFEVREVICAEPRCDRSLWIQVDPSAGILRIHCSLHRPRTAAH